MYSPNHSAPWLAMRRGSIAVLCLASALAHAADWPQWGRTADRNMVSPEHGLPSVVAPGKRMSNGFDTASATNVRWAVKLGKETFGTPTVAGGRVFVGIASPKVDPKYKGNRGALMCFREADGAFLWQLNMPTDPANKNLASGGSSEYGICSSATIDGNRAYVTGYGCDVLCIDVNGLADGNAGPFTNEARYCADRGKTSIELDKSDGDIVWRFSVFEQLGVQPHDAYSSSPLVVGNHVYLSSGNSRSQSHDKPCPTPEAPSLIVLDKQTGALVAADDERIGRRILHGQWCAPSMGTVRGKPQLLFGGGDGICYAFDPAPRPVTNRAYGTLARIWSFDVNCTFEPETKKRAEIIATPVCWSNRVYVAIGHDWSKRTTRGTLACIDATGSGDITASGRLWTYDAVGMSISTVSIEDGLLYIADLFGKVHCLDAITGKAYWVYECGKQIWQSTLVADNKVYVGDSDGKFHILRAGRKLERLCVADFRNSMAGSPVAANGSVYLATSSMLYALGIITKN